MAVDVRKINQVEKKMADEAPVERGSQEAFLEEKAFESRFVFIIGNINDAMAKDTARRLIALATESAKPINVLVSSPGGHVESGDVIHDIIKFIRAPVNMIGSGWVASAGAHIFLAAPKERRVCLPNTRFLIHQPSGGMGGSASDVEIQVKEIVRMRERIAAVIARETGQTLERVLLDIDRDFWMNPEEAIEYGLLSRVIQSYADLE